MTVISRVFSVFLFLTIPFTIASPVETEDSSTLRYTPGDLSGIEKSMKYDSLSVFNLGQDGVLRTFANNLTVLDYRQLDPDQVLLLASKQITQWQASGLDIPSSITKLVESPVDGRLIIDIEDLLNPKEKPNVPPLSGATLRSVETRDLEMLSRRQDVCPGSPACESLSDCTPYNCFACYYPNGPPAGTCFVS